MLLRTVVTFRVMRSDAGALWRIVFFPVCCTDGSVFFFPFLIISVLLSGNHGTCVVGSVLVSDVIWTDECCESIE